jgi:hypothetical protein
LRTIRHRDQQIFLQISSFPPLQKQKVLKSFDFRTFYSFQGKPDGANPADEKISFADDINVWNDPFIVPGVRFDSQFLRSDSK